MNNLIWKKCGQDNHWCNLQLLDLSSIDEVGVYIIWHEGNPSRVVRIGQGVISERLREHRGNPEITKYAAYGTLRVTWASVPHQYRDGVEKYLSDKFRPLVGESFPNAYPIAVNSPF